MALAMKEEQVAAEYRHLFENGKAWIEHNLFNGSYFVQKIQGRHAGSIAAGLRSNMGTEDTENPQYQVGAGCLLDQLVAQYLADVAGLGTLVDRKQIRETIDAIYRYNHKPNLYDHDCVQRTFALNDEAAMVICDYTAAAERPRIPFPYYAEVMTGFEYSTAALMLFEGMFGRGLECISQIRARFDGERRNPWDEAECGHHYARAMAAWSGFLAASGFRYRGQKRRIEVAPRLAVENFRSLWTSGTGWGTFGHSSSEFFIAPTEGFLLVQEVQLAAMKQQSGVTVNINGKPVTHQIRSEEITPTVIFEEEVKLGPGQRLVVASWPSK